MKKIFALVIAPALTGCVSSSVMPVAQDTIIITTSAAPVCGRAGAQDVAVHQAAVETIRRGYDRFIIFDAAYDNSVRVVGHTPVYANTYGTATGTSYGGYTTVRGSATTTFSGGYPIVGGSHDQGIAVRMFRERDPGAGNAVSARETLGPEWQQLVAGNDKMSCF